eukprot:Amastigsp_a677089_100.p2 type:complete len:126 gc:universal Amastigsp_a677089_100:40-417(+)
MPRDKTPDPNAKPSPFTTTSRDAFLNVDPESIKLTRKAEEGIEYKMREDGRKSCAEFIKAFAECASGRMVSFLWACQPEKKAMNRCLREFVNEDELKRRKLEFIKTQLKNMRDAQAGPSGEPSSS